MHDSRLARPAATFAALLAAALLAVVSAGPASAQAFGKNKVQYRTFDWKVVSSPHFDVYFYQGGDSLAIRVLDLAEKANLKLTRDMGHTLSNKVPIILYLSHNDFEQTNVTTEMLDGSTGGFTELLKNRVVLPFAGSYEDLRHVVVHELTHAFMFDMLYTGGLPSFITRQNVVYVPLWFAEGLAEWNSLGWEPNADMFMREGTISGYLPPLQYGGNYLIYKEGQAAMKFMAERYGPERVRDLLQKLKFHRNFDRAFELSLGTTVTKFDEDFHSWLKKTYWPSIRTKNGPEQFARRLTDHRKDRSNINMAAAVSPLGDRVAYISDRRLYTDIYIASTLDGKVLKRVVRGDANPAFESVPSFRSSLSWSHDGKHLAFVAQSQAHDVVYVVDAEKDGKILRRIGQNFDAAAYPAFAPDDDRIVFSAVKNGRTDLYLVDAAGTITRLTDDTWDEKEPAWSPDGKKILFSSDRAHPVTLTAQRVPGGFGSYAIYEMDLATRTITQMLDTSGDDGNPVYAPDGKAVAFVSDRDGALNAYLYDIANQTYLQLTDLIGGVFSLSWSRENDRLVFSAFNTGGWDIFAAKEPLSLSVVRANLAKRSPRSLLTPAEVLEPVVLEAAPPADSTRGALAPVWPDTAVTRVPPAFALGRAGPDSAEWREPGVPGMPTFATRYQAYRDSMATLDSLRIAHAGIDVRSANEAFLLPDSLLGQEPKPYRRKFSTEFASGQLGFNSAFGFAGSTIISVSDFLGNDRFLVSTDIFAGSLDNTNILAYYYYLPKRWDYGFGVFHYKNYYYSRTTPLGEQFQTPQRFSDRNVGFTGLLSYPFNRFKRVDIDLNNVIVDRSFFAEDEVGNFFRTGSELRVVTAPSVTFVKDTGLYSYYGPVSGGRYYVYGTTAIPLFDKSLSYFTVAADWRKYFDLGHDYQFAMRGSALRSTGRDAQVFEVGGYSTIRGVQDFSVRGTNVAFTNLEFRFPFINAFGVVGPVPLGFLNLRGAAFADFGAVWTHDNEFQISRVDQDGHRTFDNVYSSLGVGARSSLGYFILKLDVAWPYYLDRWGRPRYHFSLSPQF
jgi:Tol biopolymer transport system component